MRYFQRSFLLLALMSAIVSVASAQSKRRIATAYLDSANMMMENTELAIEHINKSIYVDPFFVEAYLFRADIHESENNMHEALMDMRHANFLSPEDPEIIFQLATLEQLNGNYPTAIQLYRWLLDHQVNETKSVYFRKIPGDDHVVGLATVYTLRSDIYNALGFIYATNNNIDSSRYFYSKSLEEAPGNSEAISGLLNLNGLSFNYEELVALLQQLENDWPLQAASFQMVMTTLFDKEQYALIIDLMKAVPIGMELQTVRKQVGISSFYTQRYQEAIQYLKSENGEESNYYDQEAQLYSALSYYYLQDYDRSEKLLLDNFKNPSDKEAYFYLGNIAFKQRKWSEAEAFYILAIHHLPEYAKAYYNLAMTQFSLKEYEKGCINLAKAGDLGMVIEENLLQEHCL